ncbi:site-specific integrase [Carboxydothermus hydrogenoformans]|uniref:Prophage LambdaCh01, site-specific recombinase, phage integrase family n=1 Tax=Carboxydothermus hydrogenoformans (strain ATCC BAA-161 / DSM 6008 / Z-2901) TaxID=246194 RepID=Q3ABG2_CARHZ|nr:site-specific integrase [Carboxydothermus hydrogenoformans]ABB16028.1 prophage LambdaCh01, site-specific recombinase, phage integrase family [Carboxydothermus hydrogenoformans Z-2901]
MRGHIRKRGNYYSVVLYLGKDENGKKKYKWIGGFKTKKEAEKVLAEMINKVETNNFIFPEKITLKEFLNYWLENYVRPNLSPTTAYGYEAIINLHIIPFFKNIELQKVRPIDIQQYYNSKRDELSGKTLLQHHRILHKAFDFAMKLQLIPNNPIDFVDSPKAKKYKAKILDLKEIKTLLNALKDTDLEVPINLALSLGLRRGELLALKWEDVNWEEGTIQIRRNLVRAGTKLILKEPKSETSIRTLKLSKTLLTMLKNHRKKQIELKLMLGNEYKDTGFICCKNNGEMINPSTFSHQFSDFLKKHGLPDIRLHDLRHTNATLMLKSNIPAKIASSRLGHSTVAITLDLYSHVLTDMDEEVANKIDDIIYQK